VFVGLVADNFWVLELNGWAGLLVIVWCVDVCCVSCWG